MQPPPHARTWEGRDVDSYLKYTLGFKCIVLVGVEWGGLGGGGGGLNLAGFLYRGCLLRLIS